MILAASAFAIYFQSVTAAASQSLAIASICSDIFLLFRRRILVLVVEHLATI
jgi:hypothetical protein